MRDNGDNMQPPMWHPWVQEAPWPMGGGGGGGNNTPRPLLTMMDSSQPSSRRQWHLGLAREGGC